MTTLTHNAPKHLAILVFGELSCDNLYSVTSDIRCSYCNLDYGNKTLRHIFDTFLDSQDTAICTDLAQLARSVIKSTKMLIVIHCLKCFCTIERVRYNSHQNGRRTQTGTRETEYDDKNNKIVFLANL